MRLEYAVLLERLESQLLASSGMESNEHMARPIMPVLLDDTLNLRGLKSGSSKVKKQKPVLIADQVDKNSLRNPNLPRQPESAFVLFCKAEANNIKARIEHASLDAGETEVLRLLSESWNSMSDEQRKPFEKMFEDDLQRYQQEMQIYNKRTHTETDGLSSTSNTGGGEVARPLTESQPTEHDLNSKRQKVEPSPTEVSQSI